MKPHFLLGLLFLFTKLPTSETVCTNTATAAYGADVAASIRVTAPIQNNSAIDVVALFLPANLTDSEVSTFAKEKLYSFYLTGQELYYMAEGVVSTSNYATLYLDGLHYTYHRNRLPFDRILSISATSGETLSEDTLYHIVSTDDIFTLFETISYRSLGIMNLIPKDSIGTPVSDLQNLLLLQDTTPFCINNSFIVTVSSNSTSNRIPSIVTMQDGYNLIALISSPNQVTLCVLVLLITLVILLWYIVPRIRRIRVWFRIYLIRRKKRSSRTFRLFKK